MTQTVHLLPPSVCNLGEAQEKSLCPWTASAQNLGVMPGPEQLELGIDFFAFSRNRNTNC